MARKGTPISKSPAPTPEPAAASELVVMTAANGLQGVGRALQVRRR